MGAERPVGTSPGRVGSIAAPPLVLLFLAASSVLARERRGLVFPSHRVHVGDSPQTQELRGDVGSASTKTTPTAAMRHEYLTRWHGALERAAPPCHPRPADHLVLARRAVSPARRVRTAVAGRVHHPSTGDVGVGPRRRALQPCAEPPVERPPDECTGRDLVHAPGPRVPRDALRAPPQGCVLRAGRPRHGLPGAALTRCLLARHSQ